MWIAAPEQHNIRLRTYGQASTTLVYEIFGFAASFYGPYMLSAEYGNMGLSVGYFYTGMSSQSCKERSKHQSWLHTDNPTGVTLVMLLLTFFCVPETARLTLEQIDDYFSSGRPPWKTSTRQNVKIAKGAADEELPVAANIEKE